LRNANRPVDTVREWFQSTSCVPPCFLTQLGYHNALKSLNSFRASLSEDSAPLRDTHVEKPGRSVGRARGYFVRELGHCRHDPAPGRRPVGITGERELVGSSGAFLEGLLAVALEHQLRRPPNVDLGYHAGKAARPPSIKA
jgi:hypothetical protein